MIDFTLAKSPLCIFHICSLYELSFVPLASFGATLGPLLGSVFAQNTYEDIFFTQGGNWFGSFLRISIPGIGPGAPGDVVYLGRQTWAEPGTA